MKFGQLIGYNKRNNFLDKSYRKCCGVSIPSLFPKNSKLSISLKFYTACFMLGRGLSKYSETKLGITWFYHS